MQRDREKREQRERLLFWVFVTEMEVLGGLVSMGVRSEPCVKKVRSVR